MSKQLNENAMRDELSGLAFFKPTTPSPAEDKAPVVLPDTHETAISPPLPPDPLPHRTDRKKARPTKEAPSVAKIGNNNDSNTAILRYSNIAIQQEDLRKLKHVGYKAQSFRLTDEELDRLKDLAYSLSKITERKVTQADLLRFSLLLLDKTIEENQSELVEVLQAI